MERSTPLKVTIMNDVDREEEYQRLFWARRPDGIVVDKEKEFWYVLEFKKKWTDGWGTRRRRLTERRIRTRA